MLLDWLSQTLLSCYSPVKNLVWLPILRGGREVREGGKKAAPGIQSSSLLGHRSIAILTSWHLSLNSLLQINYFPNIILTFLSLPFYLSLFPYQNCIPSFKVKCILSPIFPNKNDLSFSVIFYHLTFLMLI